MPGRRKGTCKCKGHGGHVQAKHIGGGGGQGVRAGAGREGVGEGPGPGRVGLTGHGEGFGLESKWVTCHWRLGWLLLFKKMYFFHCHLSPLFRSPPPPTPAPCNYQLLSVSEFSLFSIPAPQPHPQPAACALSLSGSEGVIFGRVSVVKTTQEDLVF